MTLLIKKRVKSQKLKGNLKKSPYIFEHKATIKGSQLPKKYTLETIKKFCLNYGKGTYLVLEKTEGKGPFRKMFYGVVE